MRKCCEINAITLSTMKREVQSLKSELRALRTDHLFTIEVKRNLRVRFLKSLTVRLLC